MNNFLFPFNTCEKINKDRFIQQPYSAFINGISAFIVLYFLLHTKLKSLFFLFLSIFVFQIYHKHNLRKYFEHKLLLLKALTHFVVIDN